MSLRVHFLGGADEVGASCVLVEAGAHRILVDAGVRMGASARRDRLPDLARATDVGGLDAILLTHAHLDHAGALPLVHGAFPRAPVLMTEPTLALLRVLLLDALRIMQSEQEEEIPLYPLPAVEALLARACAVRFLEPQALCGGAVRATFLPAGHILGAAAVSLESDAGTVLITGDVSLVDQLTVPGMPRPRLSPDLVVCESTYGARLHASRRAEEERLTSAVVETLQAGGKVLVPAFALGRAQEVLLLLRRSLARPDAPPATMFFDGMVRAICAIYDGFSDYLAPRLRERAASGRGLFATADGRVQAVQSVEQRQALLEGDPCVVVSSSGMLSGGPSPRYAAALAGEPRNLIAITGYQDEEAPGRRLQQLAAGEARELSLDGRSVQVRCRVGSFGLSAHADAAELAGLVRTLGPRVVALVHGDDEARRQLARGLLESGCARVELPAIGGCLELEPAPRRAGRPPVRGIGEGRDLDEPALAELHRTLWSGEPTGRTYSARDLAERWLGSAGVPADLGAMHALLRGGQRWFVPDARRPYLYRCADPQAVAAPAEEEQPARMEQNAALALAESLLGESSGLYRKGAERESWTLRLSFQFPDVAAGRHADLLQQIARQTGWQVALHPEPHLGALERLARELVAPLSLARPPSIHVDRRLVRLTLAGEVPAEAERLGARLLEQTGFELELAAGQAPAVASGARDDQGRMEINATFAAIDAAFVDLPHRPTRRSKKRDAEGELVELSFISPEVGARHREQLDELSYHTGWRIRVADRVDQQAVLRVVAELVPATWQQSRGPGLDVAGRKVLLRLGAPPPEQERAAVAARLRELTGFELT